MDFTDISTHRLHNQQLLHPKVKSVLGLVSHFGAVQSQDYAMAKWAVGSRLYGISDKDVDDAIDSGEIVRTHVLRPTWHFTAAEDIGWMLDLTAKSIRGQFASMDKKLGLDEAIYKKSFTLIEKALRDDHLTRLEIMEILEYNGIRTHEYRSGHIMAAAELERLVISGKRKGKDHTYALLDERVKKPRKLNREEALAELALRYFTSHGPATLKDFQWWSGLNQTNCRLGIAANESNFETVKIEETTYYFTAGNQIKPTKSTLLLPAFDEFLISYKDRTPSIDAIHHKHAFTNNGIFKPILVVDAQVCGVWKRTIKNDTVNVEVQPLVKLPESRQAEIKKEAGRFADFLRLKLEFKMT